MNGLILLKLLGEGGEGSLNFACPREIQSLRLAFNVSLILTSRGLELSNGL